jgi:hypothetical protein
VLFRELIRDGKPYPQRLAWSFQVEVNMEMDGDLTCLSRGISCSGITLQLSNTA